MLFPTTQHSLTKLVSAHAASEGQIHPTKPPAASKTHQASASTSHETMLMSDSVLVLLTRSELTVSFSWADSEDCVASMIEVGVAKRISGSLLGSSLLCSQHATDGGEFCQPGCVSPCMLCLKAHGRRAVPKRPL